MDVMKIASLSVLACLVMAAVLEDFSRMKISNRLILTGIGLGLLLQIQSGGAEHIIRILANILFPVILLYLLFLAGILGAGDIKLFSMIGAYCATFKTLCHCILFSFIAGGVYAFFRLLKEKRLTEALSQGISYLFCLAAGNRTPYPGQEAHQKMHFSAAIAVGLAAALIGENLL